jgi:hypothetical protein
MVMTDNQLKGNWAEQYISARLAERGCLVRHVPQGHDIGIDLYCETIEEHTPFLHFWCQIKTSKKWKGEKEKIHFSPNEREKEYWIKQPVPVFVFLVPDLRDKSTRTFIPFYICRTDLREDERKIYSYIKIKSSSDLSDFLSKELPLLYFLWELREGKVSSLKTVKNEYTRFFPSFITQHFENNLLISLRNTLWRLSHDIMFPSVESIAKFKSGVLDHTEEERVRRAEPYVKAYQIITEIQNYSSEHYEVPCIMGLFSEMKTKNEKALSYYEQSLSIIERDKNIDTSKGYWKNTKNEIQEYIKRTKRKLRKTR